jgi:uncharacterized protein with HEPN domain
MKDDSVYLIHVLECIKQIEEYTAKGREEFMNSRLIQDAVIRNIEIIGDAIKQIYPGLRRPGNTMEGNGWYAGCADSRLYGG